MFYSLLGLLATQVLPVDSLTVPAQSDPCNPSLQLCLDRKVADNFHAIEVINLDRRAGGGGGKGGKGHDEPVPGTGGSSGGGSAPGGTPGGSTGTGGFGGGETEGGFGSAGTEGGFGQPAPAPPPVVPEKPPTPPQEPPPPPKPNCKRADCVPGAPGDSGKRPHSPDNEDPNKKPNTGAGASGSGPKTGDQIHGDLVSAIKDNKPEVVMDPYTKPELGLARDRVRAGVVTDFPVSDDKIRVLFGKQGFRTDGDVWRPAVMDKKDFDFSSWQRGHTPESESSEGSVSSGEYAVGIPLVENYHDVGRGTIMVKNQLKVDSDVSGLPWSEKTYQMVKEDFGPNPNINKIGVTGIISESWRGAANKNLANVPEGEWRTYPSGSAEYNDFLQTVNGKWAGLMLTDHHGSLGNKVIDSLSVTKVKEPDGDIQGYMVMSLQRL